MVVVFFFRKEGFSIERVFEIVISKVQTKGILTNKVYVPESKANLFALLRNLFFSLSRQGQVNHITGDIHYLAIILKKRNTILTIHDCVMVRQNSGIRQLILKWLWLKIPSRRLKYITTISEFSKSEIVEITGCNPDKIYVIRNPVNPAYTYSPKPIATDPPKILHFTGVSHKNTERVLDALKDLNISLVLIGKVTPSVKIKLNDFKGTIHLFSDLTDNEILDHYISSDIILFPSLFEGFGMPIIEAQAIGRVVITSNIDPMKEVAGNGAHFVDPFNVDSIRDGILEVINNNEYRDYLIESGLINIKRFAVEKIAEQYLDLYKKVNTYS